MYTHMYLSLYTCVCMYVYIYIYIYIYIYNIVLFKCLMILFSLCCMSRVAHVARTTWKHVDEKQKKYKVQHGSNTNTAKYKVRPGSKLKRTKYKKAGSSSENQKNTKQSTTRKHVDEILA